MYGPEALLRNIEYIFTTRAPPDLETVKTIGDEAKKEDHKLVAKTAKERLSRYKKAVMGSWQKNLKGKWKWLSPCSCAAPAAFKNDEGLWVADLDGMDSILKKLWA